MSQKTETRAAQVGRDTAKIAPQSYMTQFIERLYLQLTFLTESMLFLSVVALVVFAISELAARDTMLTLLNSRSEVLKSEFVERSQIGAPTLSQEPGSLEEGQAFARKNIEAVENIKRNIQALSALGAVSSDMSLRELQRMFSNLNGSMDLVHERGGSDFSSHLRLLLDLVTLPLLLYSSDQLLAIVVLGCGSIGAMISSLRANESLSLRAFILGLASGFVTYLIIKGGNHIFLLRAQGEIVAYNPYGSAFAGLLAGLFTEKAHQLLSFLVDDLTIRVRAASANSPNSSGSPPLGEP